MKYAKIIVDISREKLDHPFDYLIPDGLKKEIKIGTAVHIPFGRSNRIIKGYVVDITDDASYDTAAMKEIDSIIGGAVDIESELISIAWWIKENYGSTMNQALKTVIPVKSKVKEKTVQNISLNLSESELDEKLKCYQKKRAKARIRLLLELQENKTLTKSLIVEKLNISNSTLKTMEQLGDIKIEKNVSYRNPVRNHHKEDYNIVLNQYQQKIVDDIKSTMDFRKAKKLNIHLIYGVTGSGKTEIYINLIDEVIRQGKSAIVLIPEIALTYQTVLRFTKKFGNMVSVMNSRLSKGERYDQFERAKKGDVQIMIGPRSALFTPFKNLGLIVIDEEHDNAYKSESVPKYNAIEVAQKRVADTGAVLVLGSATPSLESYYLAKQGVYTLHSLGVREKGKPAEVSVVDLREELKQGNKSVFSAQLKELIDERLQKKEQIMLFINRRGYAGFVSCRDCGKALRCPHCDVTLKLHRNRKLICHYCGYTEMLPALCPDCGSKYLGSFGIGTQQVESLIKKEFPMARVLRMDADTTNKKDGHQTILSAFANKEAEILVGTQMIVKGHDFPNVTLVGVIAADLSLYESDFKASERTFQLLCQAAGRAGRSEKPGQVVIQTYAPDHYSIQTAARQDYCAFFEAELAYRTLMGYPPVAAMVSILLMGDKKQELDQVTDHLVSIIYDIKQKQFSQLSIIGPATPPVSKIKDIYRTIIYLKAKKRQNLVVLKNHLETLTEKSQKFQNIVIQYNFTV